MKGEEFVLVAMCYGAVVTVVILLPSDSIRVMLYWLPLVQVVVNRT